MFACTTPAFASSGHRAGCMAFAAGLACVQPALSETADDRARPQDAVALERVVVIAKRDPAETSFKADRSETATRQGTALLDVPASVTVITGKVLETQQAASVDEALRNASGVVLRQNAQGPAGFQVRGFSQTGALVNGVTSPGAAQLDVNGIERIEVLKGPQAILSGGDSLGGALNIVTKKPQAESVKELLLQYGSFAEASAGVDLGGALDDGRHLSYRVIGSWTQARRNDAGFDGREHRGLMPQLRWKDADTDLIVGAAVDRRRLAPGRYTFALDGIQPPPPIRLGNADDGMDLQSRRWFYSAEHAFGPHATLVSRLQLAQDRVSLHLYGPRFPTSTTRFGMAPTNDVTNFNTLSGDHYLRLAFDTGALSHRLSTGLNHTRQRFDRESFQGDLQMVDAYADVQYAFPPLTHDALIGTDAATSRQHGLFVQDLIGLGDVNLLLSLRRTRYENGAGTTTFIGTTTPPRTTPARHMGKTTPSIGMVYRLQPDISLYASYAEGFLPQFSTARNCAGGEGFDPMETKNKELGAKFDLLGRRLAVNASIFSLAQSNRLVAAGRCFRQRDAIQLRGLELDVQGEVTKGWRLLFNYTLSRQKDAEQADAAFAAQPRHAASLWTTYDFQQSLQGWGVGLGVTARSRTLSDYDTAAVPVPGSALVDASLFYRLGRWAATLGVKNVFDRGTLGYATTPLYVPLEAGRTFKLTLRTQFDTP